MANSDKNILITPNTGSALNPTIAFTGSNASPITMSILDTGALSFSGTSGQLFSIVDSLSGSIFSVNDISGIPSLEILDTGLVKLNQYGGNTAIGVATPYTGLISSGAARLSISTISAATAGLIVKGKPSQSENLVEFYRSSADANAVFKIQTGLYSVYIDNLAVGSNVYANYQIVGGAAVGNIGNYLHQFNSWNAAWVTVGVRGAASQTANLQEWQNSAGTAVAAVGNTGTIRSSVFANLTPSLTYIATNYDNSGVGIVITNSAYKGLVVRGVASQTADLQQWQNSSGFGVLNVLANGNIVLGNSNVGDNNYIDFIKAGGGGAGGLAGIRFGSPTAQQTLTIDTGNAHLVLAHKNATSSFIVRGFTSQSADLEQWQDVSGSTRVAVSSYGTLFSYTEAVFSNLLNGAGTALIVKTNNAGGKPLIVQGAASQTADLQQWINSSDVVIANVAADGAGTFKALTLTSGNGTFTSPGWSGFGTFGPSGGTSGVTLGISPYIGTNKALVVRGAASQTADLQQWQDSAGTVLSGINPAGQIFAGTTASINGSTTTAITSAAYTSATVAVFTYGGTSLVQAGQRVTVASVTGGAYNGTWTVTAVTSTTFTVLGSGFTNVAGTGGTFTLSTAGSFVAGTAATTPIVVRAAASQTANLQEWQNSAGTVLAKIAADGAVSLASGGVDIHGAGANFTIRNAGTTAWYLNSSLLVGTGYSAGIGVIIRGNGTQTADLQQWQSSAGSVGAYVASDGSFITRGSLIGGSYSGSALFGVQNYSTTQVVAVIKGAASQTANLQEWQNSAGTVLNTITASGTLVIGGSTVINSTFGITLVNKAVGHWNSANNSNYDSAINFARGNTTGSWMSFGSIGDSSNGTASIAFQNSASSTVFSIGQTGNIVNTITSAASVGLTVKGAASQTANLQEWQASDGTVYGRFNAYGSLYVSNNTEGGTAQFGNTGFASASSVVLKVKGSASQTANLQEWQNSAGTVLASVGAYGEILIKPSSASVTPLIIQASPTYPAAIQQWQNSSGTTLAQFRYNGALDLYDIAPLNSNSGTYISFGSGALNVLSRATTTSTLIVKGVASQTADLQQWQSSDGSVIAKVDTYGYITSSGAILPSSNGSFESAYGGAFMAMKKVTSAVANPIADVARMYLVAGTTAGTLKLVIKAGTAGAETTILDNIPQS